MTYTQDEYQVVQNSPFTYEAVAAQLRLTGSVHIGWTDDAMTHMDVVLHDDIVQVGPSNRLDASPDRLWVGVIGYGLWAFHLGDTDIHSSYVAEKLGFRGANVTVQKLTDLINGVNKALA